MIFFSWRTKGLRCRELLGKLLLFPRRSCSSCFDIPIDFSPPSLPLITSIYSRLLRIATSTTMKVGKLFIECTARPSGSPLPLSSLSFSAAVASVVPNVSSFHTNNFLSFLLSCPSAEHAGERLVGYVVVCLGSSPPSR